jgi:lipopolysaccharide transport system permease protein
MQCFKYSPSALFSSFWLNRRLIYTLVRREVAGRYQGSIFGLLWPLINPIFMLFVYVFVFSVIFSAKWAVGSSSKIEYALILFPGLLVFNLFAECINNAPSLIVSNANYVKKVIFPLEIFPWVYLGAALFHFVLGLGIWLIAHCILIGPPPPYAVMAPFFLFPFLLVIVGLMWIISSLGVFIRDITQFVKIITSAAMFISPIFFPVTALPAGFQSYLYLNPLTFPIESTRNVLLFGALPSVSSLVIYWFFSIAVALLGFACFQKTRKGFADVL